MGETDILGANQEVTGSRTLLEWNEDPYLLVDEGMKLEGKTDEIKASKKMFRAG